MDDTFHHTNKDDVQDTCISDLKMVCGEKVKAALTAFFQEPWGRITYGMVGSLSDEAIDVLDASDGVKHRVRSLRKIVNCFRPGSDTMDRIRLELTCPISLEIAKDPVVIPCCGRVLERREAIHLRSDAVYITCPCCRSAVHSGWISTQPARSAVANVTRLLSEG